jgi:hypothetical protein
MAAKTIYLVSARRGDYSDRTEYPVCWFAREAEAKACALHMEQKSAEWRSRAADSGSPWDVCEQAQKDIGDPQWNYYDNTDYAAFALERGSVKR